MFEVVTKVNSLTDNVTKYILKDATYGKNEVSLLRKDTKDVIVLPTQTNCVMGCTFCHLTGTTRPAKNLTSVWLLAVVQFLCAAEALGSRPLLVSFMGAGEPLLNLENVLAGVESIKEALPATKFALATVFPRHEALDTLVAWCQGNPNTPLKLHLSVHGMKNRHKLIRTRMLVTTAINLVMDYAALTGNAIEYHYTLVDGVNDSIGELCAFSQFIQTKSADKATVKFLTLSEVAGCQQTELPRSVIASLFDGITVEFYDPPGRDVGSSCGMFDRSIYMEEA